MLFNMRSTGSTQRTHTQTWKRDKFLQLLHLLHLKLKQRKCIILVQYEL